MANVTSVSGMSIITTDSELKAFCETIADAPYITIDTEFLRDTTYYPVLCLFQVAAPGIDPIGIDPIKNPDIDFEPLFDLLFDPDLLKVCHAGRQDMEILFHMTGRLPHPVFDTQIAAMVCGYGDQVGYDKLVQAITGIPVDKSSQFTDWSRRPLSDKQLDYALGDVTHLRDVYESLVKQLEKTGRVEWIQEEMMALTDQSTFEIDENTLWQRIKVKSSVPKVLARLRGLAAWRELEARRRDVPKTRIIKDDGLANIAMNRPKDKDALSKIRMVQGDQIRKFGDGVMEVLDAVDALPASAYPAPKQRRKFSAKSAPIYEMLRMLQKIQCAKHNVSPKLVACTADLEALAMDDKADVPAMHGWRHKIFGQYAIDMKHGKTGLTIHEGDVEVIEMVD